MLILPNALKPLIFHLCSGSDHPAGGLEARRQQDLLLQVREAPSAPAVQAGARRWPGRGCHVPGPWPPAKVQASSGQGGGPITLLSLERWKEALMGSGWAPAEAGDPLGARGPPVPWEVGCGCRPWQQGKGRAPTRTARDAAELIARLEPNHRKPNFPC